MSVDKHCKKRQSTEAESPVSVLLASANAKSIKIAVVGRWVPGAGEQLHTSVCRRPICNASMSERGGEGEAS